MESLPQLEMLWQALGGLGDVLEVTPNEMGGYASVTVQWRTPAMNTAQDAQSLSPAPSPAQSLTFVRRK
jgi:hypothetical protein